MASYSAIAETGETLVGVLRDRMASLIDDGEVALASPADLGADTTVRVTLYLYRIEPNAYLRNTETHAADPETAASRPLALDLYYLLTAYPGASGADETARSHEQQRVLGRAMQVLNDESIVTGSALRGSLVDDGELRLSIDTEATTDPIDIWSTFSETPYQPSVSYVVGPVFIDAEPEVPTARVLERRVGATAADDAPDDGPEGDSNG